VLIHLSDNDRQPVLGGADDSSLIPVSPLYQLNKALGVPGNPYAMLVKSDGEVFWEHSGYRKGDEVKMEEEVKTFFASAPPPPEGDATEGGE